MPYKSQAVANNSTFYRDFRATKKMLAGADAACREL